MGLRQLEPPKCEPVTLQQAKVFLRVDHASEDALIQRLIKTARQSIESYTGRALIRQCWIFSVNAGFVEANSDPRYLSRDQSRGTRGIELPKSPFMELVGPPRLLTEGGQEHSVRDYRLDTAGRVARLHLKHSVKGFSEGRGVLAIQFWAGYGSTPEEVPDLLRQGILRTVATLYEGRVAANDIGFLAKPLDESTLQLIRSHRVQRLF